jgi:hypothetical protein
MKRNFLLIIGIIAILFPMSINAQEGPKISGFVQGLYQANLDKDGKLEDNTLRMRRVRLSVDGKFTKSLSYKIQGDFINSPMLVDAYIKYKPCNEFAIQFGQFKLPFTLENPINPLNLEIFDYGESIQKLVGYSDVCGVGGLGRDIGVMISGDLFKVKGKDFSIVNYSIGVFNGNGPINFKKNEKGLDNNNRKDIVGRLEIHPILKALTLTASYYHGYYFKDTINTGLRDRWSAGVQYNDGDLVIRGEYIEGTTGYNDYTWGNHAGYSMNVSEESFYSRGFYAVAGYYFHFGKDNSQKLMPVLRYEQFKNDGFATDYYTVGINYWPVKSVNFKLDYSLIRPQTGINSNRIVAILSYKF